MPQMHSISDIVREGQVVAAGPGDGPDGAAMLVWVPEGRCFNIWETKDGSAWERFAAFPIEGLLDWFQAAVVGAQLAIFVKRIISGEPQGSLTVFCPAPFAGKHPDLAC